MKFLTLYQPWASLIACGAKQIETRSWATSYRGWLGIHAASGMSQEARMLCRREPFARILRGLRWRVPQGVVVAMCKVRDCVQTPLPVWPLHVCREDEEAFGDFRPRRYAWMLDSLIVLPKPVAGKGRQRIWSDEELAERVQLALGRRFP